MKLTVKTKDGGIHPFTCDTFKVESGGLTIIARDGEVIAYFKDDWSYVIREIA